MPKCECGCGQETVAGQFVPGHDQRLRATLEKRAGGLLAIRDLLNAAESYAIGKASTEELATTARRLFAKRK